jgi:hypothetical protein
MVVSNLEIFTDIAVFMLTAFTVGLVLGAIIVAHLIKTTTNAERRDQQTLLEMNYAKTEAIIKLAATLYSMPITSRELFRQNHPRIYKAIKDTEKQL